MSQPITILAGVGSTGTSPIAPGLSSGITCIGFLDTTSDQITLTVSVTPSGSSSFLGCHLYLEAPDQSSFSNFTVGTTPAGGTSAVSGQWKTIDLGRFAYVARQQPWIITLTKPANITTIINTQCRLYAISYSDQIEKGLVQANQTGASPSVVFTLITSGPTNSSTTQSSATNVTVTSGAIVATALDDDGTTGKLMTPVIVIVSVAPTLPGWVGQLILTWLNDPDGNALDPSDPANALVVGSQISTAGIVYGSPDGIAVPHSFAVQTPTSPKQAIVWLQSGVKGEVPGAIQRDGYSWNNIVPGITPSWPLLIGTNSGTIDARHVMTASIAAEMSVVSGLFGIAPAGITNPFMGPGSVATLNIQALAVTNPILGALAVQSANLANSSVTAVAIANLAVGTAAMQLLSVDTTIVANAAISNAKIIAATITGASIANATIAGANIGTATIANVNIALLAVDTGNIRNLAVTDAKIGSCNVAKLTAGTINVSVLLTAASIVVPVTGGTLYLNSGVFALRVIDTLLTSQVEIHPGGLVHVEQPGGSADLFGAGSLVLNNTYGITLDSSLPQLLLGSATLIPTSLTLGSGNVTLDQTHLTFVSAAVVSGPSFSLGSSGVTTSGFSAGSSGVSGSSWNLGSGGVSGSSWSLAASSVTGSGFSLASSGLTSSGVILSSSGLSISGIATMNGSGLSLSGGASVNNGTFFLTSTSLVFSGSAVISINGNTGYTGTLAAAIAAGSNVIGGIIY